MRPIDADYVLSALSGLTDRENGDEHFLNGIEVAREVITNAPTIGGWISVKERLPEEHPSMFYKLYGTEKWSRAMWRTESDRVLVTIKFPDGTRKVDKGILQDGAWRTGVSPVIPQEVTHWALWPEPPKEDQ